MTAALLVSTKPHPHSAPETSPAMKLLDRARQSLGLRRPVADYRLALPGLGFPLPSPARRSLTPASLLVLGLAAGFGTASWLHRGAPGAGSWEQAAAAGNPDISAHLQPASTADNGADLLLFLRPATSLGLVSADAPTTTEPAPRLLPAANTAAQAAGEPAMAVLLPPPAPVVVSKIDRLPNPGSASDRADQLYQEANLSLSQGQVEVAIRGLQSALKEASGHVPARQLLVKVLIDHWEPDSAEAVLREGITLHPGETRWIALLARLQAERGDTETAWRTLQPGLKAAAGQADFRALAANVLQRLSRNREALEHFDAAVRLAPEEGRWWVGLGISQEAEGMVAEARNSWQRAKATGTLTPDLAAFVDRRLKN